MGMATSLVIWPGSFEQTFVPLSQGVSKRKLILIGPWVVEEEIFENVDDDDGRRMD